jgi:hypothetical protein
MCKRARVTPLHKTGNKEDPNNYRPISILPFIGKIIEYFVGQQLTEYMEENHLFWACFFAGTNFHFKIRFLPLKWANLGVE